MAPDAIHPHALSHQCNLARASLHLSTVKTQAHSGYLPVTPERPTDSPAMVTPTPTPTFPVIRNLPLYLWGALQSVLCHLWAAKELLSCTRVLLFLCSGYLAREAMKGDAEKSIMGRRGAEEVEEEEEEQTSAASLLETQGEEEREVLKMGTMVVEEEEREREAEDLEESSDEDQEEEEEEEEDDENEEEEQVEVEESESDWMEWESEEEEEIEDEDDLHQQTGPTGICVGISFSLNFKQASDDEKEAEGDDEENSDWSDDDGDDDDSEASAESVELWESFLHSGDPYNPLSFSCTPVSRSSRNTPASTARGEQKEQEQEEEEEQEEREDQQHSTHSTQQKKKVRFSDEVTVRPLVAWAFASKAARNGSCWMEMVRDRDRFRRRVEDAGKVISPCLSHDHRRLVWERLKQQSAL